MSLLNNLYPPITHNYQASFLRSGLTQLEDDDRKGCDVYFALPPSITEEEALNNLGIQMSVVYQNSNISALKAQWYSLGIKIAYIIRKNQNIQDDYKYYVRILPQQLKDNQFLKNQHYKVQLRFFNKKGIGLKNIRRYSIEEQNILRQDQLWVEEEAGDAYNTRGTTLLSLQWLNASIPYCSEWSSACIIKGIKKPTLHLKGFEEEGVTEETVLLRGNTVFLNGQITFEDGELETLKNYNIKLYYNSDKDLSIKKNPFKNAQILVDSGDIFTNYYGINEINYELKYYFEQNILYTVIITYETTNSYKKTEFFNFKVRPFIAQSQTDFKITATPDRQNGKIKINVTSDSKFIGNLNIRRTSSKYNYSDWEDIHTTQYIGSLSENDFNYIWNDRTIESGVWYKYGVQKIDSNGNRQNLIQIDAPVMCIFQHMFLTGRNKQLSIMFNPTINNFKYNVTDTQQTTLGAKHPYIVRNSENYYRSFSIGGLISTYLDTSNWYDPHFYQKTAGSFEQKDFHTNEDELGEFITKNDLYNNKKELTWGNNVEQYYNNYNIQNNITQQNDYIYERQFREKVYDFLYEDNVKLFRSTTEGNILVKLTDISFQPNETLGRRIYSFTATATEIDEANINNYNKYNIQPIGNWSEYIELSQTVFGHIDGSFKSYQEIFNKIKENQQKKYNSQNYKISIISLNYVKIEITGQPTGKSSHLCFHLQHNNNNYIEIPAKQTLDNTLQYGFLELDNVNITSLKIVESDQIAATMNLSINYMANIKIEPPDPEPIPEYTYKYIGVGQIYGNANINDRLMKYIKRKYNINKNSVKSILQMVYNFRFQAPKNAVLQVIQQSNSQQIEEEYILFNGYLNVTSEQSNEIITDFYFKGIHFNKATTLENLNTEKMKFIKDDEYIITNINVNSKSEITNLIKNGIYTINNQNYIYYGGDFYPFDTNNNNALCPIETIITYDYDLFKGVYNI